ncbi:MAG: hypothetical protein U1F87_04665 [Kiritimatiellia bacterium]
MRAPTHFPGWSLRDLRAFQVRRLREHLAQVVEPFLPCNGGLRRPGSPRGSCEPWDDLQRIPLMSKADLLVSPARPDRARDFVLIPGAEALRHPARLLRTLLRHPLSFRDRLELFRPVFLTTTTSAGPPTPFPSSTPGTTWTISPPPDWPCARSWTRAGTSGS